MDNYSILTVFTKNSLFPFKTNGLGVFGEIQKSTKIVIIQYPPLLSTT